MGERHVAVPIPVAADGARVRIGGRRRHGPPCARAERAEMALVGLEHPLGRYLLEADRAEGRSWYGEPGPAELVEWEPVLKRAGVVASPVRVAQAYLELAVLSCAEGAMRPPRRI